MQVLDFLEEVQVLLGDPHGDVHTPESLLPHFNRAQRNIASRSRCIADISAHAVIEGQYQYGLPVDLLRVDMVGYRSQSQGWRPLARTTLTDAVWRAQSGLQSDVYGYDIWGKAVLERWVQELTAENVPAPGLIRWPGANLYNQFKRGDIVYNLSDGDSQQFIENVFLEEGVPGNRLSPRWYCIPSWKAVRVRILRRAIRYVSRHRMSIHMRWSWMPRRRFRIRRVRSLCRCTRLGCHGR